MLTERLRYALSYVHHYPVGSVTTMENKSLWLCLLIRRLKWELGALLYHLIVHRCAQRGQSSKALWALSALQDSSCAETPVKLKPGVPHGERKDNLPYILGTLISTHGTLRSMCCCVRRVMSNSVPPIQNI